MFLRSISHFWCLRLSALLFNSCFNEVGLVSSVLILLLPKFAITNIITQEQTADKRGV